MFPSLHACSLAWVNAPPLEILDLARVTSWRASSP